MQARPRARFGRALPAEQLSATHTGQQQSHVSCRARCAERRACRGSRQLMCGAQGGAGASGRVCGRSVDVLSACAHPASGTCAPSSRATRGPACTCGEGCRRGCTNQTRVGRRYKSKGIKLGNKTPLPGRSFRSHALPQAGIQSSAHTQCLSFVRPDSIDLSALRPRLSPSLSSPSLPTPRPRLPTSAVSTSPQAHSVRYPSLSLLPVAATRVSRRPLLHRA